MKYSKYKEGYYNSINADIRKHHYWRGFKACAIVCVPVIIFLSVCAYLLINAAMQ